MDEAEEVQLTYGNGEYVVLSKLELLFEKHAGDETVVKNAWMHWDNLGVKAIQRYRCGWCR